MLRELAALPSRNVSVRVLTSVPSVRTNSTDLKVLKQSGEEGLLCRRGPIFLAQSDIIESFCSKGVQVRKVNLGLLTGGVLHSKFWIVDRKHVFIGSANMDWRAITQVKLDTSSITGKVPQGSTSPLKAPCSVPSPGGGASQPEEVASTNQLPIPWKPHGFRFC